MMKFKDQGVGVGLRLPHLIYFRDNQPKTVDWVEVITENYLPWRSDDFPRAIDPLLQIRQNYPLALHGVSMNLGSTDPVDRDFIRHLQRLIERTEPFIVSDHLSWTAVGGQFSHDLLPLPYTNECLRNMARKIDEVQNLLKRPLLIENPSLYLAFEGNDWEESDFIGELLKKTGAYLLLDINNVYVNSVNQKIDAKNYLRALPHDRVAQIHLAGHTNKAGFLIDTHDAPVCPEVWELYSYFTDLSENPCSAMIERDAALPPWAELEEELNYLRQIKEKQTKDKQTKDKKLELYEHGSSSLGAWQKHFLNGLQRSKPLVVAERNSFDVDRPSGLSFNGGLIIKDEGPLKPEERLAHYTQSYHERLVGSLRDDAPHLLEAMGESEFRRFVESFILNDPPVFADLFAYSEYFLRSVPLNNEKWREAALRDEITIEVSWRRDWHDLLSSEDIKRGVEFRLQGHSSLVVRPWQSEFLMGWRKDHQIKFKTLSKVEKEFFDLLQKNHGLEELSEWIETHSDSSIEWPERVSRWIEDGVLVCRPLEGALHGPF